MRNLCRREDIHLTGNYRSYSAIGHLLTSDEHLVTHLYFSLVCHEHKGRSILYNDSVSSCSNNLSLRDLHELAILENSSVSDRHLLCVTIVVTLLIYYKFTLSFDVLTTEDYICLTWCSHCTVRSKVICYRDCHIHCTVT